MMLPTATVRFSFLLLSCVFITVAFTTYASAQWSDDADINLPVATGSDDQIQPKMVLLPDGGTYVSWFSGSSSGYDVWLQRLDADGNAVWAEGGILVAERSLTSTQEYGLSADDAGNALLAFRDDRSGDQRVTAAKVSPDGDMLWGENGTDVSGQSDFVASPKIIATPDGGAVVGYAGFGEVVVKFVNPDGSLGWETTESSSNQLTVSDMVRSDNAQGESSYVVLLRNIGPPTIPGRLSAQAYSAEGNRLWGINRLEIMTSGSLQMGNFPDMISDGNGGVLIYWYQSSPALQVYVQQVYADGSQRFATGGITLSTNSARLRSSISAVVNQDTDDIYAFWRETDSSQNSIGLYGQRINAANERSWGNEGIEILAPVFNREVSGINTFLFEGEPVVAYSEFSSAQQGQIFARKFDTSGSHVWEGDAVGVSTLVSNKSRLTHVMASQTEAFFSWQDSRNGTSEIWAQNLLSDGSLGQSDDEPDPEPEMRLVTFTVDMSIQRMSEIFRPETGDVVHVLGSFNDWSVSEENGSFMSPGTENPDLWSVQLDIEGDSGEEVAYKFFIEAGDGRPLPNDGWENNDVGPGENGNRIFTLTEDDAQLPAVFFNNNDGPPVNTPREHELPRELHLAQNYPNPFNPTTQISYTLPERTNVRLEVYNSMGQRVMLLHNGSLPAGQHFAAFDGSQLASGVYIYRLEAGSQALTRKMVLIK